MIKTRLAAALIVTAVLSSPAPVFADHRGEPVYNTRYYSDWTYTEEVGTDIGVCENDGIQYIRSGQATAYAISELAYWCGEGGVWYPPH